MDVFKIKSPVLYEWLQIDVFVFIMKCALLQSTKFITVKCISNVMLCNRVTVAKWSNMRVNARNEWHKGSLRITERKIQIVHLYTAGISCDGPMPMWHYLLPTLRP